jgi:CHRD domain
MKRLGFAICLISAMAVGCDDDNPAGASDANTVIFTAQLNSANETPPISNAEAGANGTGIVTFTLTRDSGGTITAASVNFRANLQGFPSNGATLRLTHIHTGAAGVAGPVLIDSTLSPATAVVLTGPTGTLDVTNPAVSATGVSQIQAIIDNPANFYFNIHSNLNPGGVVRGQLVRQ